MTREPPRHVKVGDVILVGVRKDRRAVVHATYGRGMFFATSAERGFTSWRLAALPPGSGEEAL